ncbi:dTDP-4-dehydrorhamnose reductase family protein [Escherichia albertii]|uniref:dTDP-4-dehydrorhamnose reductase family protein n=1 Tax=Escherichia albertii TaxID=208962 RepID=UPI000BF59700|nr:SDR family oxidoreductase [Escherichia albertii]MCZ8700686.1 SDR family oxidoreductase [Escherichia albertii]PFF97649.1 NAD(P)-dependent oxidoreductase [Escherichia albertii]
MSKKILVIGANGMLGSSLLRFFTQYPCYKVLGTVRNDGAKLELVKQGFNNVISGIDVTIFSTIEKTIDNLRPDYVFNCVGIIKQLDAAKDNITSISINSLLPHKLARLCSTYKAKLIHFSTDCVFSGKKGNYNEKDLPDAYDLYGKSKQLGEVDYGGHLTLRTSIIGHEISSHHSLVDWFLSQKNSINGYSNAVFSGLPTVYVAEVIHKYIIPNAGCCGLRHLSVEPINKYELLGLINEIYSHNIQINNSKDLKIDRSLDSSLFRQETGFAPLNWPELIEKMNNEYNKYFR